MRGFVKLWDDNLEIFHGPKVQRVCCPYCLNENNLSYTQYRGKTFFRLQFRRAFLLLAVDFSLYYYTSAEVGETKMVLPVHQATKVCLSMTSDKKLQISVSLLYYIKLLVFWVKSQPGIKWKKNSADLHMCAAKHQCDDVINVCCFISYSAYSWSFPNKAT